MKELLGQLRQLLNNGARGGYLVYATDLILNMMLMASPDEKVEFKKLTIDGYESGQKYYTKRVTDLSGEWTYFVKTDCTDNGLIELRTQ